MLGPNLRQEVDNILTELSMIINKKKKTEQSETKSHKDYSPLDTTHDNEIENINQEIRDFTREYIQTVPHRALP